MNPVVSIIIPIYNGEKYIDRCMEYLFNQTYKDFEVLLINDGSKDTTARICDDYAKKDSRIRAIHQANKGVSIARNTGIDNACGKYVLFIDIDDEIEADLIKDNVQLAEDNNADLVMYCFWYYHVDADKLVANDIPSLFVGSGERFFREMLNKTIDNELFNPPWNKLIKRSVLVDNKIYFDTNYRIYEDMMFTPNLLSECSTIVVNNKMYYKYILQSSGTALTKFYDNLFESASQFYKNSIKYSEKFADNESQVRKICTRYSKTVIMHIKQISCRNEFSKAEKYERLRKIVNNEMFRNALDKSELNWKKNIVRILIKMRWYKMCCILYRSFNKR